MIELPVGQNFFGTQRYPQIPKSDHGGIPNYISFLNIISFPNTISFPNAISFRDSLCLLNYFPFTNLSASQIQN